MTDAPASYEEMVQRVMAKRRDDGSPIFTVEREAREWIDKTYPQLRQNWAAVQAMAGRVTTIQFKEEA